MNVNVSIIMPCHNGEDYIEDAIKSVITQTYEEWELLIIDDNSVDKSYEIAKYYAEKDSRINVFKTEESLGLPAVPRNIGLKQAKGRFIAFLDCDDIWIRTKLEHQLSYFDISNVAVVYSNVYKMDVSGNMINKYVIAPKMVTYKTLLNGCGITSPCAIYDTKKTGIVYQKEIHHEDYLMWLEILSKGFVAINTETFEYLYRVQKNSISGNKLKTFKWHWNILRNEINLGFFDALKHFICYIIKGLIKYIN